MSVNAPLEAAIAHEQRIQNAEADLSELKVSHAETQAAIKYLGIQMTENTARVVDKIDAVVKPLTEQFHAHVAEDTLSRVQLDKLSVVVGRIEDERGNKKARARAWKAAILAIITGASAISLKELVVLIVRHW